MGAKAKDMVGLKFGKLTVIRRAGSTVAGLAEWWCECDCGNICVAIGAHLREGRSKSCGCVRLGYRDGWFKRQKKHQYHLTRKTRK